MGVYVKGGGCGGGCERGEGVGEDVRVGSAKTGRTRACIQACQTHSMQARALRNG